MTQNEFVIGIAPSRVFPGTWWDMVELCQRLGFGGVEFKHELPFILPDRWGPEMVRRIAQLGRDGELMFSLHGPYTNIGALLPNRWKEAVDEHLKAMEIAQELGARIYTIHPGWVEKKYCTPELLSRCQENTSRALAELLTHADGVKICLENQNPGEQDKVKAGVTVAQLCALVRDLPEVGFTFDLGHAQVLNSDPTAFVAALGPHRIGLAHIHDNDGQEDAHLPPGMGRVNWVVFLSRYRQEGWNFPLFLEVVGTGPEFKVGRQVLLRTWADLEVKTAEPGRRP